MNFNIIVDQLSEPFSVATPNCESILVERAYHDCHVSVNHKRTMENLIDLDMVYFDVIVSMDCIHAYYALVDCKA